MPHGAFGCSLKYRYEYLTKYSWKKWLLSNFRKHSQWFNFNNSKRIYVFHFPIVKSEFYSRNIRLSFTWPDNLMQTFVKGNFSMPVEKSKVHNKPSILQTDKSFLSSLLLGEYKSILKYMFYVLKNVCSSSLKMVWFDPQQLMATSQLAYI